MASVLANTGWSVAGRVASGALGVVVAALISRLLGVNNFGDYALLLSLGALLQTAADFGLYLTVTRQLGAAASRQQTILSSAMSLRLVLAVVVFGLGGVAIFLLPTYRFLLSAYAVAALGFLFQSWSQLFMGVYQTYGAMWRAALGDFVGRLLQVVVVGVFISVFAHQYGKVSVVFATAAFAVSAAGAYLIHSLLLPQLRPFRLTFAGEKWKELLTTSWPLALMLILSAIYFRIDILMLSWFRPAVEVGWYGLAYRIVESLLFIPAAFGGLLLPKLSATRDTTKLRALLEQSLYALLIAGGLVCSLLISAGTPIVTILSGAEFSPAGPLLSTLAIALLVMFFGNLFGFTLVAQGKQRSLLVLYAGLVIFAVIANSLTIPHFGAPAAAWVTVATEALSAIVAGVLVHKSIHFRISFGALLAISVLSVATWLVCRALLGVIPTVPALILAMMVYGAGAWAAGLLKAKQFKLLMQKTA
ncbi:MAG: flippase [Candidatus Andersenbacteria bacterium]|nr:flippase [Candidatus Andersenbacteria bacterium]MBI3250757.1 flippase [Candidatus Andersenbacteria bacterium]